MSFRHPQFIAHCASLTDSELCSWLASAIEDVQETGPGLWSHQVVYRLHSFQGFSEKEGLRASVCSCYFEKVPLSEIAEAYDHIGLPDKAAVMWRLREIAEEAQLADQSRSLEASLFQDNDDLIEYIGQRLSWDLAEKAIFDDPSEFTTHLSLFIRQNLGDFQTLDLDLTPIRRDPPNTGYLASMKLLMDLYAWGHGGQLLTLAQLKDRCMHDGIKRAASENYQILANGNASEIDSSEAVIRYHHPCSQHHYIIHGDGAVTAHLNEPEAPEL